MKYMGSKSRIAKHLLPFMMKHLDGSNRYIEPFVGGCGMMENVEYGKRIGNDSNPYLIGMWKLIQSGEQMPYRIDRDMYSKYREFYHRSKNEVDEYDLTDIGMCGWVGFMGSFNGRFYDGGYSGHDVNGRDYISENIRNTLNTARFVNDVEFTCGDYADLEIIPGDVVYVDPPYKGTTQYAYSKNFDYERLYQWIRDLKSKGAKVFMSEYCAPDDFRIVWESDMKTCLNPTKTKIVKEKLFEI